MLNQLCSARPIGTRNLSIWIDGKRRPVHQRATRAGAYVAANAIADSLCSKLQACRSRRTGDAQPTSLGVLGMLAALPATAHRRQTLAVAVALFRSGAASVAILRVGDVLGPSFERVASPATFWLWWLRRLRRFLPPSPRRRGQYPKNDFHLFDAALFYLAATFAGYAVDNGQRVKRFSFLSR